MRRPFLASFLLSSLAALWAAGAAISGEAKSDRLAEWEKMLAAAKKEGRVVVVGPPVVTHRQAILKFQEAFPEIRLEYTGLLPAERDARIGRERQFGQYLWDVMVDGIGPTLFATQMPAGWFEPLKPALVLPEVSDDRKWLGGFDSGFLDRRKTTAYAFSLNLLATLFVNRDIVPEPALGKVEELLDPRWKGKIAWGDPLRGPGSLTAAHLRGILGDDGLKRLLVDQQPAIYRDNRQLAEVLVRGSAPIAIGVSFPDIARFQKEKAGLNVKRLRLPVEGMTPAWGAVLLVKPAPNPNAAKVFLNWLLGKQGQSAWAELGAVNSRRLDVAQGDPETALDPSRLSQYRNLSSEENITLYDDAVKFAASLLK